MIQKAQRAGLLEDDSWGDLMDDLSSAWRKIDGPTPACSDDDAWVHTIKKVMTLLEALGLSTKTASESKLEKLVTPGKRGRPVGSKNKSTLEKLAKEKDEGAKPVRKRGRPKGSKNKKTLAREAAEQAQRTAESAQPSAASQPPTSLAS